MYNFILNFVSFFLFLFNLFILLFFSENKGVIIRIADGTFKWGKEATSEALKDLNFSVRKGELLAVVGAVGSGKVSNIIF